MQYLLCPACGADRPPPKFGLAPDGHFDTSRALPNELNMRIDHYGGRAKITVERTAAPLSFALGLRDMLKFRLAQVEADIRAAGVTLDDD
jgi:hypothetical protein